MVAHIHPDTWVISIVLHGTEEQTRIADEKLTRLDTWFTAGGWAQEELDGYFYWRKTVIS